MNSLPFWKSKTFWIAGIQASLGVVAVFSAAYPDVGWLMIIKSILDIYIRSTTTKPVSL